MRYRSLRIVASICRFTGIGAGIGAVIVSFVLAIRAVELLYRITPSQAPGLEGYVAALTPAFLFLIGGIVSAIITYAAGMFLMVIMDIEENTRSIDYKLGSGSGRTRSMNGMWDQEDSSLAPTAPKPLASFPPAPEYMRKQSPVPPGTYDERLRDKPR